MEINTNNIKLILVLLFTFYGFIFSILISIGQLLSDFRSIKSWLFLGLFFVFSLFQIHYIAFELNLLSEFRIINALPITAFYLLGPLVLIITKFSLIHSYKTRFQDLFHFLPAVSATVFAIIVVYSSTYERIPVAAGYFYNQTMHLIGRMGWLLCAVYVFSSVIILANSYILSKQAITNNPSAIVILVIFIFLGLAFIFDIIAYNTNQKTYTEASALTISLIVVFLFLINFKYPGYYKTLHKIVEKERRNRSYLTGIDSNELSLKLDSLMEKREIFADETISLAKLAQRLDISQHQLSEYLNEIKGIRFSTFINEFRIKKAKEMLLENLDKKILAIAYDVGFQSKSTFNSAFVKFEKTTPSRFRKKHAK